MRKNQLCSHLTKLSLQISIGELTINKYLKRISGDTRKLKGPLKKTLWPIFIDGVQLPQSYRVPVRRQFTF